MRNKNIENKTFNVCVITNYNLLYMEVKKESREGGETKQKTTYRTGEAMTLEFGELSGLLIFHYQDCHPGMQELVDTLRKCALNFISDPLQNY